MLERVQLPALPVPTELISVDEAKHIERSVCDMLPVVVDIPSACEWLRQADAVDAYLQGRKARPFVRGAQRRLEARIGQLLGDAERGKHLSFDHDRMIAKDDRRYFRIEARALPEGDVQLSDDEWRNSRRQVVALVRERLKTGHIPQFSPVIKPTDNWNFSPVRYGRIDGDP